ncbi:polysaccharide lyase family 7 protein [Sphingomonas sp. Leaf37]|uniref:polysaccharide lyase family 7 protein n=1 Tax=Sphingomonas sp. Leaf37 TaxID=2876552 RepID=UPI001E370529|nr:polysaccharide lyase family 7 protein [Sphingomonas sp. Leaf37]
MTMSILGPRPHLRLIGALALFGIPSLTAPLWAADSCSGTAPFDFASQWDAVFANTLQWQYPETSACLTASNGLGSRKLDGKLYQKDGQLYFSTDSGPLKRSELRSKGITSSTATMSGQVFIRTSTSDKKFTIAQLLNSAPSSNPNSSGSDPIIRLEIDGGALDIVYYTRNGSSSIAQNNVLTSINDGSSFTFEIRQYKSSSSNFDIEVIVNGNTALSRRTVSGYDDNKGYFKAGCYVNSGGGSGCRSSFSRLSFNL